MQLSQQSSLILNGKIEEVFPLFGFWEEKKWAFGWKPVIVFPDFPDIKEGTVFKTESSFIEEPSYNWIISKYEPENYFIEYIVSTQNRIWVIKVQCLSLDNQKTKAIISYSYVALNETGKNYNQLALNEIFKSNLKDWEEAINYYIETGNILEP